MALTVDATVARVVNEFKTLLTYVGLSTLTNHTNPDVTPAIADALWYFGVLPDDYPSVSDSDIAATPDLYWFFTAVKLQVLYRIQSACTDVDSKIDKNEQKLSQFMDRIAAMIASYEARVPKMNIPRGQVGQIVPPTVIPGYRPGCNGLEVPTAPDVIGYPFGGY